MDDSPPATELIVRLLVDFREFQQRPGESGGQTATRWLSESTLGRRFSEYLDEEAGLVATASTRLAVLDDEELRELGAELRKSAQRLWTLIGEPAAEGS